MKTLIATVILGLSLVITGCATTPSAETDVVVHSDNRTLRDRLAVVDVQLTHAGDVQRAQLVVENHWAFNVEGQYQFRWFDRDGFAIQPQNQPWLPLIINGKSQAQVQAVAPSADAVRYEFWVRD